MKKIFKKIAVITLLFSTVLWSGFVEECVPNNMDACYRLGKAYLYGEHGFDKNEKLAKSYLGLACDQKVRKACKELDGMSGNRHKEKMTTEISHPSTSDIKTYKEKCLSGNMFGCYQVGRAYWDGNGVKKNPSLTKQFFELSCEGNEYWACLKLSYIYSGAKKLVSKDNNKVFKYAKLACDNTIGAGCEVLDSMYAKGEGVDKNIGLSKNYLEKSRKYFKNICESDKYKKGLREEQAYGCLALAMQSLYDDRVPKDYKKIKYYLDRGCKLGDLDSCQAIEAIYEYGEGTSKIDYQKAAQYSEIICNIKGKKRCDEALQLRNKKSHFDKKYIMQVIRHGSDKYKDRYLMGTMPPGMAQDKDAQFVAEYIANGMKGKQPPAYAVCAACHGADGGGIDGVAPSLAK